MIPNSQRINRGGLVLSELVDTCRNHGFTDIVVLHEHRGEPGGRRVSRSSNVYGLPNLQRTCHETAAAMTKQAKACGRQLSMQPVCSSHFSEASNLHVCKWILSNSFRIHGATLMVMLCAAHADGMVVCHLPYGPTAYCGIFNTVLRHDIGQKKEVGTISEAYPHLVFDKFTSQLGQRIANILKHLFPVPKDDSKRVVTFANADDYISFRHHTYTAPKGAKSIELKEVSICNDCDDKMRLQHPAA